MNNCCWSWKACSGRYNSRVANGLGDECANRNWFEFWDKYVKDKKAKEMVQLAMEVYDFEPYKTPPANKGIQEFYQAKYAYFQCYDNDKKLGLIPIDEELIDYWERKR